MKKRIITLLTGMLLMSVVGGGVVYAETAEIQLDIDMLRTETTDFAVRLFQNSMVDGENTLISPLSVIYALAMTANGAEEETLAQMEEVLGLPVEELNIWLRSYMEELPQEEACRLSLANGIWFKDDTDFQIEEDFLNVNEAFYDSEIKEAPFDETTLQEINTWVEEKTDGMIEEMLEEMSEEAILYLVNALAFDAKWENPYHEYQVNEGIFATEDGTKQVVEMMSSKERLYLEDENAIGFMKYYEGGAYAFAALMPNEGVSVADYVAGLTGEHIQELLSNPEEVTVYAGLPKFETKYGVEMSRILKTMGMTDAFDAEVADFSRMGGYEDKNISIGQVLHKTLISVTEEGTRAGAATIVEMLATGALIQDFKEVELNRPFVYMLIDCENKIPFFVGTLMNMEEITDEENVIWDGETKVNEHQHELAKEPQIIDNPVSGYCGNIMTTVYLDGKEISFMYDDSVVLTDILINLAYDPEKICRCMAEFEVDTESGKGYEVNLTEGFVRFEGGQAELTEEQVARMEEVIERLREEF